MGRAKKMATVTSEGSRLERLENLALILAKQIDICAKDAVDGPPGNTEKQSKKLKK